MKTYLVGGAVRDKLLGLPPGDNDYVVVGSTPEAMLALGFKPVGRDFPVFLHAQTGEEHALARTERKKIWAAATSPSTPSHRRMTARWSIHSAVLAISRHVCCAMQVPPSSKIPCACCVRHVSWRASPRWVSAWRRKHRH